MDGGDNKKSRNRQATYYPARQIIRARHRPTPCSCNRVLVEHRPVVGHLNLGCCGGGGAVDDDDLDPCPGTNWAPNGCPASNCSRLIISCK